jgi:hypothetical protein
MGHSRTFTPLAAIGTILIVVSGVSCDKSSDFGESLLAAQKIDPNERSISLDQSINIPGDLAFNIADTRRESANGGESSSGAETDGTAFCKASVRKTGEAWGEFTLGRVISNDTEAALPVTVTVQAEFEFEVTQTDQSENAVPEKAVLKFVIKDSSRRVIERSAMIDPQTVRTSGNGSDSLMRTFSVLLAPRTSYHLLLAGRVEADAQNATNDSASIVVRHLTLTVKPNPTGKATS